MTGQTGHDMPRHDGLTPTKPAELRRQERKDRVIAALREHGTLELAALAGGISRSTLYRWREDDPTFEAEVKQWLDEDMEAELHTSMFRIATSQDPKMANAAVNAGVFLLKATNRERYGDQLKTENTQHINVQMTITTETRNQLRAEQLAKVQALRTLDVIDVQEETP